MIDVAEALRRIQKSAVVVQPRRVKIEDAVGLRLQEDVTSDTDSPPWHRSMMDGFAVVSKDFVHSSDCKQAVTLEVVAEVGAGETTGIVLKRDQCIRIMTGAPMPAVQTLLFQSSRPFRELLMPKRVSRYLCRILIFVAVSTLVKREVFFVRVRR